MAQGLHIPGTVQNEGLVSCPTALLHTRAARTCQLGDVGSAEAVRVVAAAPQHLADLALPKEDLRAQAVEALAQPTGMEKTMKMKPRGNGSTSSARGTAPGGFQPLSGRNSGLTWLHLASPQLEIYSISGHTGVRPAGSASFGS